MIPSLPPKQALHSLASVTQCRSGVGVARPFPSTFITHPPLPPSAPWGLMVSIRLTECPHLLTSDCVTLGGCSGYDCTRHAPSTAMKARGAISVSTSGTILCQCVCGIFWWVLCQWLSHWAPAV